jgi:pimeloyl-ACP methyl ester carboxylesterase
MEPAFFVRRFYFHGFLSESSELQQCLGSGAELGHVHQVDWFAHAKPEKESFEDHAVRTLEALDLKNSDVLIGYSMGGRLLVEGARVLPPCRVHLLSTHPGLLSPEQATEREAFAKLWAERLETWKREDFETAWNSLDLFQGSHHRGLSLEVWKNSKRWAQALRHWGPQTHPQKSRVGTEKLKALATRMSVCWHVGEKDSKYRALVEADGFKMPFVVVPGAGHRVLWDQPQIWKHLV